MARPLLRVAHLDPDLRSDLRLLFGSAQNVYDRLGLAPAPWEQVRSALYGRPCLPALAELIQHRWAVWRATFLGPNTVDVRCMIDGEFMPGLQVTRFTLLDSPYEGGAE
jgi:hypothetical protein